MKHIRPVRVQSDAGTANARAPKTLGLHPWPQIQADCQENHGSLRPARSVLETCHHPYALALTRDGESIAPDCCECTGLRGSANFCELKQLPARSLCNVCPVDRRAGPQVLEIEHPWHDYNSIASSTCPKRTRQHRKFTKTWAIAVAIRPTWELEDSNGMSMAATPVSKEVLAG